MTEKEYLLQARYLDERIHSKVQQVESLNDLATSCSAVISDMPRNPNRGGSKMADAVIKICFFAGRNKYGHQCACRTKREIMGVIKCRAKCGIPDAVRKSDICALSHGSRLPWI